LVGRPLRQRLRSSRLACAGPEALNIRLKPDAIVHGVPQSLFAPQIAFRCLYADVPEQELYLLEFSSYLVAESRACSPKIVRRNAWQSALLGCVLYYAQI